MMDPRRVETILRQARGKRVLVVGDLMLDRYVKGQVSRLSPEAPVPVVHVTDEIAVPGGAANVALNVRMLGGSAMVAGVVGEDAAGAELLARLDVGGIDTSAVARRSGYRSTVKTRVIADRQQVVRLDYEDGRLAGPADADWCRALTAAVARCDAVILEDYGKGVLTDEVAAAVMAAAAARTLPVGYDPKLGHQVALASPTLVTPNFHEACHAAGLPSCMPCSGPDDVRLAAAAAALMARWEPACLIVTLGPAGMYVCRPGKQAMVIPTRARAVFDVSGAGDTVIAAAMLAVAAGADYDEAATLANYAAGVVCGKVGTATCSPPELLEALS